MRSQCVLDMSILDLITLVLNGLAVGMFFDALVEAVDVIDSLSLA